MGLTLSASREGPPWPVPTFIALVCDGQHGLFPPERAIFDCEPWFPAAHTAAMRAGWKETYSADGRPLWLGPCCSGKAVMTEIDDG